MKKRRFQSQPSTPSPSPAGPKTQAEPPRGNPPSRSQVTSGGDTEPIARRAAVPAILFGLLAACLFWADVHIMGHGGELDARVHYPFNSTNELGQMHITIPEDPRMTMGRELYPRACASCHQTDGSGGVSQNCPPLAGSDWVNTKDPNRLIHLVLKGATGPIVVNGKTWSGGTMTPFEESFGNAEIAAILSYVRNSWGNKAPMVDEAEVAKVRTAIKDKRGVYNSDELLQMPVKP